MERRFKDQELDKLVINHVLMFVNRNAEACGLYDVAPEITTGQ
jgi:hypothetical protein